MPRNEIANLVQDGELGPCWVDFVFHTLPCGRFAASIQQHFLDFLWDRCEMKTVSKMGAQFIVLYVLLTNWTWLYAHPVRGALAITVAVIIVRQIIEVVWRKASLRKLRENIAKAKAGS